MNQQFNEPETSTPSLAKLTIIRSKSKVQVSNKVLNQAHRAKSKLIHYGINQIETSTFCCHNSNVLKK